MAGNKTRDNVKTSGHVSVEDVDETSPLLESQTQKPSYVTFPDTDPESSWRPSPGFWWIETGA